MLSGFHPGLIILATVLATILVVLLFVVPSNKRNLKNVERKFAGAVSDFVSERTKSEEILNDLDVGVIAYGKGGVRINVNPAAKKMFQPASIPDKFDEFIDSYGQDNGVQAALLLGSEAINGKLLMGDKILRMRIKLSHFEEGQAMSRLVVLNDVTEQEREEQRRKEFVANVSHELKTPLTTIKTYSESLIDWGLEEKPVDAIRKDIWRIHDDSLRMERLVEDLLLLSSIDSKGIRVRMETLNFASLVRQVVDRLHHQAKDKQIELSCYTLSRIPAVYIDKTSMERVITNLLSNAIKYTERGGQVKVYISYLIDDVYVKVSDTGFGIDKEHLPRIFNRFYRVDMTGSRMFGGTGLGLSIAKELVDLHDGKINVASTLGKGTEFTVMIPIARKVFCDTLEAYQVGSPMQGFLYQTAAQALQQHATDMGFPENCLSDLTDSDQDKLLSRALICEEDEWSTGTQSRLPAN